MREENGTLGEKSMSVLQFKTNEASTTQAVYPPYLFSVVNEEEVNPDEVFYISFAAQISDLSLQIFIPLNRLVFPLPSTIAPRVSLIEDSFLKHCYEEPLKHFEKSQDLIRLESILRIIEGERLRLEGSRVLPTLSRYFEALSVYGGTLTANHWVFEEDSSSLTVWSMLSYYCHCLDRFAGIYPHILHLISEKLIEAFERDRPILREIFEYEKLKEQYDYLALKRIELQVRKFYELTWEQPALEEGGENVNIWGMSALLNFPECKKLSEIKNRKIFSSAEKRTRAEKIWEDLSFSHSVRDQVMRSDEVIGMNQAFAALGYEMNRRRLIIERRVQRASLNEVKKALQGLYEYEQLGVGFGCTQQLLPRGSASPEVFTQWLVVLRESLKMMVTDKSLNISTVRSLSILSNLVKTIRDYFEHPEDYVLRLDYTSEAKKQTQRQQLEAGLFNELKMMGKEIAQLMKIRMGKIQKILQPHPSIDPQDAFRALVLRDTQPDSRLPDARQLACERYSKVMDFAERIIDKRNREEIEKIGEAFFFIPFPQNLPPQELLGRLQHGCEMLCSCTTSLSRSQLEKKILEDVLFRLMIQRHISVASRLLDQFMKHLKKYRIEDSAYKTLENVYFEARDTRNFQTHDLWRMDIQGIVNTVYLLGYDCPEVLSSLLSPNPFSERSLEAHVIQQVVHGRLTQEGLNQAIDEGFNLNAYDYKHRSLLHFLAEHPSETNLRLAQFVIQSGGNVHRADHVQMRPIHYAAESGFKEMAQLLIDKDAVVDAHSRSGTPTEIAQSHGHTELAQFLSNQRGIRRSSNAKALLDAVKSLDAERVQVLVAKSYYDPLADFDGSLPLVALFEKEDVDFHVQIEIARILFQAGADVNQQEPASGQSVLHVAANYTDEPKVIKFLMSFLPHVNLQDGQRRTPLHNAVCCKNKRWVKALLSAGASLKERDFLGNTPLLSACNMNWSSSEIIEALLKHGANVEAENKFGRALHHVAERGGERAVSIVLEHGASPFVTGRGGLYYHKMPYELSRNRQVTSRLIEKMQFLFSHLSEEDQDELITTTGRDLSPFQDWKQPTFPTLEQEREFLGRFYKRRFC